MEKHLPLIAVALVAVFIGYFIGVQLPREQSLGGGEVNLIQGGITMGSTSIDASSKNTVLSANVGRRYAALCNDGASTIYLNLSAATATANTGIPLAQNGCFEILPENLYIGAVTAITLSGTSSVATVEK